MICGDYEGWLGGTIVPGGGGSNHIVPKRSNPTNNEGCTKLPSGAILKRLSSSRESRDKALEQIVSREAH